MAIKINAAWRDGGVTHGECCAGAVVEHGERLRGGDVVLVASSLRHNCAQEKRVVGRDLGITCGECCCSHRCVWSAAIQKHCTLRVAGGGGVDLFDKI